LTFKIPVPLLPVGVLRCSTKRKNEDDSRGQTMERSRFLLDGWKKRMQVEFVELFTAKGVSGASLERKDIRELLKACSRPHTHPKFFNAVVFPNSSRASRNVVDFFKLMNILTNTHKKAVFFVEEDCWWDLENASTFRRLGFDAVNNQGYRIDLIRKTKDGIKRYRERHGHWGRPYKETHITDAFIRQTFDGVEVRIGTLARQAGVEWVTMKRRLIRLGLVDEKGKKVKQQDG